MLGASTAVFVLGGWTLEGSKEEGKVTLDTNVCETDQNGVFALRVCGRIWSNFCLTFPVCSEFAPL